MLGKGVAVPPAKGLNGLKGRLTINGEVRGENLTDDPMGALAWCANLAADRGRPLEKGQVVITGSVIATFPVAAGDAVRFGIEGWARSRQRWNGSGRGERWSIEAPLPADGGCPSV